MKLSEYTALAILTLASLSTLQAGPITNFSGSVYSILEGHWESYSINSYKSFSNPGLWEETTSANSALANSSGDWRVQTSDNGASLEGNLLSLDVVPYAGDLTTGSGHLAYFWAELSFSLRSGTNFSFSSSYSGSDGNYNNAEPQSWVSPIDGGGSRSGWIGPSRFPNYSTSGYLEAGDYYLSVLHGIEGGKSVSSFKFVLGEEPTSNVPDELAWWAFTPLAIFALNRRKFTGSKTS